MDKLKTFKVKCAILFGYNGRKFHGLQKAAGVLTVEEALEKALYDAKLIPIHNFGNLKKIGWGRASRTDKGVHASINVIKCNLEISNEFLKKEAFEKTEDSFEKLKFKQHINFPKLVEVVNSYLSPDLKVLGVKLVTKNFVCKSSATSRKYEYILPVSILRAESNKDKSDEEILKDLNKFLQVYKGTRNYHNYTKKGNFKNKSSNRFMIDLQAHFIDFREAKKEKYI